MMQISLLGSLQVLINQVPVDDLRGQRVRSIFVYLILHAETAVSRSELAGVLWPDISEHQARTNLRRELHTLKNTHAAIDACITASKQTITWRMPIDCTCDTEQFAKLCQAFVTEQDGAKKYSLGLQAATLYRDPLLSGMTDGWLIIEREKLHQQWNLLCEDLIRLLQNFDVSEQIINIATRQLSFDPYLETAYLAMMEAYIAVGNSAMALHTYHQCASILKKDLGISPNENIQKLHAQLITSNGFQDEDYNAKPVATKEDSALIGRSAILVELTAFIERAYGGAANIAFIMGESGIGKSRLAEEVLGSDNLKQLIKVRSECHPARIEIAFGPFKDWFANPCFLNAARHSPEFGHPTIQDIFPQLAASAMETANGKNSQIRFQEEIFAALNNIVNTAAESHSNDQPSKLLLYIDDIQWADTDFFNWLKYFLLHQKNSNIVFLATARTEELDSVNNISGLISDFSFSGQTSVTKLPYLNRQESCELINNTLANYSSDKASKPDPNELYDLVRGNPLFLIASVNHLMHEGKAGTSDAPNTPGTAPKIYTMLQRRIELLEDNSRQLLLHASVVQQQFSLPLIQALTQFTDNQLMAALDDLWGRGMIREIKRGDYDFAHDSLREACYAALNKPGKRIMHGQVARVLETLNPEQVENIAGEIAIHYEKAGDTQTALGWFERALARTKMTLAADRCIAYAQRSLRLMDLSAPIAERADQQMRILSALSYAYSVKEGNGGENTLQICREMEALLPYVADSQTRLITVFRLRVAATFSYQSYRALRLAEFQLSAANDTSDVDNIIAAYRSRGFALYVLGRFPEALSCLNEGLDIARDAEAQGKLDRHRPSWSLAMLSRIRIQLLYLSGRFEDALSAIQTGYDLAQCIGPPQFRAMVYMWVAKNNFIRGRYAGAEKVGETIIGMGQQEKLTEVEALGKFFCDWAGWKRGDTETAITELQQTINMHRPFANLLLPQWYNTLAEMQYSAQQFDAALQSNSKAIQAVRHTRVPNRKADIYRVRGNILAAKNSDPAEVIRLYDLSLGTSLKQSALIYAVKTLIDKINFLRQHKLPVQSDVQQLRQVVSRVQMSDDVAELAVAQSLLDEYC